MARREKIPAVKGISALPPPQAEAWSLVEQGLRGCARDYGYRELRLPLLERTELFTRSLGETADIVHKEMFSFEMHGKDSLSLRPEGTAGAVRSILEQSLADRRPGRFWYCGPMFRYEQPQKGRSRQFHQFGVEALGMTAVEIELELLMLCCALWQMFGVEEQLELQISSLGSPECRQAHRSALLGYLNDFRQQLDEQTQQRIWQNPLRMLDSKLPQLQELAKDAPLLPDYLSDQAKRRFDSLLQLLDQAGISYSVNPRLVRGLDYYTHTVFEWLAADELGSQNTVCAGGRYDALAQLLGGQETAAVGFALGIERLMLLLTAADRLPPLAGAGLFIASPDAETRLHAMRLAEELRDLLPGLGVEVYCGNASLSSQMKQADTAGVEFVVILGPEELAAETVRLKAMRDGEEREFARATLPQLANWVQGRLTEMGNTNEMGDT